MTETKEKPAEAFTNGKTIAKREADAPTFRPILIAACVGVLIGLLIRR